MTTLHHQVRAYLYNYFLNKNPNDYIARVCSERSLNVRKICEAAAIRGGADISAPAMKHSVELFFKEMAHLLSDGFSVNTGYFTVTPHIKGRFNSSAEKFNPEKHKLLFLFNQGEVLRNKSTSVKVEILGIAKSGLVISQVIDIKTGSVNDLLTPNYNLRIAGQKLKVAGENPETGIYFINNADNSRIKIDKSDIIINKPSEIIIFIPSLAKGIYRIEITTQFSNASTLLKEPRTALLDMPLTVK